MGRRAILVSQGMMDAAEPQVRRVTSDCLESEAQRVEMESQAPQEKGEPMGCQDKRVTKFMMTGFSVNSWWFDIISYLVINRLLFKTGIINFWILGSSNHFLINLNWETIKTIKTEHLLSLLFLRTVVAYQQGVMLIYSIHWLETRIVCYPQ